MDFFAVAAAAGAGYVAKYLHKVTKENDGESNSESTNALDQWRQETGCDGSYTGLGSFGGNVGPKMNIGAQSTSGEGLGELGMYQDCSLLSLVSLPPGLEEEEIFQLGSELRRNSRGLLPDNPVGEVEFTHRFPRGCRSIRSRRQYNNFAKPLNSLESCLTAQLYKQHLEMENYMHTPLPSSSFTTRPLLITDGKRVISRASSDFQADLRLEVNRIEDKLHLAAPLLPKRSMEMKRRPADFLRRVKPNNGGQWSRKVSIPSVTGNVGQFDLQGSRNGMHLFLLGVTIGILSTAIANKREVEKLNELLKQTESLVQDLQEEIEMKHSMTVKELVMEKVQIQDSDDNIFALKDSAARAENQVGSKKKCSKDNDQIMSQIEAELEAELERLELNMKSSTLERIADFVELDRDYEADVANGEFRLDTITKLQNKDSESDEDYEGSSSSGHTFYANRPISPKELSLRLHEVIEARLEARIKELETALEDSQKRVRSLEHSSIKAEVFSEKGSATPHSSLPSVDRNNIDHPLVINLAGDGLDAYNEAYEEIFRMIKTEDETPPDTIYTNKESAPDTVHSRIPAFQNFSVGNGSPVAPTEKINWEEQLSDDENGDDDDMLGKLLIQQIVEKSRQGSSLVLNAQRMVYSMGE